jgi:hypothetical protein
MMVSEHSPCGRVQGLLHHLTYFVLFVFSGGCFVTKVAPHGSAAQSRGVEVGDQLATINGALSGKITVDNICTKISKSANPKIVELVFLRYIGPLRPASGSHRGGNFELHSMGSMGSAVDTPVRKSESLALANSIAFRAPSKEEPIKSKKGFGWFGRKKNGAKGK